MVERLSEHIYLSTFGQQGRLYFNIFIISLVKLCAPCTAFASICCVYISEGLISDKSVVVVGASSCLQH